ncbi:hypothetical protein HNQ91_002336 [Filimonas zeae]|uniref:Glutaminyl-tRNA synthetase n=1 Tax=Filimonas zeae TaxID=1737353 RepID=A0A917MUB6_9BACT|nr:zinc-dependent metalloprotease [Filimonas zeae]MDR6339285.1 hypothetical protein [Filimonas zeae]GGH64293.1 glutaminyl-tRNA synthetase [Filimonas zeae]
MKKWMTALTLLPAITVLGQEKEKAVQKDSVPVVKSTTGLQAYEKVITKAALTRQGMFTVHLVDNKYYFEIPDSLLGREILAVTRYVATPEQTQSYGGEKVNEQTLYFERGPQNKLFARIKVYRATVKDTTEAIYKAMQTSGVTPIAAAFDIKCIHPANGNVVIEVTDFFRKDNSIVAMPPAEKTEKKLSGFIDDRSFINSIRSYPINVEVKTTKTFSVSTGASAAGSAAGALTFELNTSMVLLPKVAMRRRLFDNRVGYFASRYSLYGDDLQEVKTYDFIARYRLEPKDEEVEKYKRGELVEPKKQIVYYIDPATPKKWRPYLMAGVNDWQNAFEQAGFKNAIVAKEWPENDTAMSMEDARFSVIRYFASDIPNAYGPHVSDPRSGEILESHVGWYHNVMNLVRDWYIIQAGPLDARARKMEFDDELMGDLIRFVSSHEIGHTLGLRHNMGASSQTPVEKLRDKAWVEANGHTVSIMDYARFNYVAQPEDNIGKAGLYPRIGMYDKWAIQWGYKNIFNTADEYADSKVLNKWIVDSLRANPRLWFGGEGKNEDPRSQTEDLGDDHVKASDYGIANLKRVVAALPQWTAEEGDLYNNLAHMHKRVASQYLRYVMHAMKNAQGGAYVTEKSVEETGNVYTPIPKAIIQATLDFMGRQVIMPPLWLYPAAITGKIKTNPMEDICSIQNSLLNNLLNPGILYTIMQKNLDNSNSYTVPAYLTDVKKAVWRKFTGNNAQDVYLRNAQRAYVDRLVMILKPKSLEEGKMPTNAERSDARLYVRMHLTQLKGEVLQMSGTSSLEVLHKQDLIQQIDKALNPDKK